MGRFFYCQPCLEGVVVPEVFEEADRLDGLAEAHLVGQDEAVVLAPGVQQEVYPINLKGKTVLKTRCRDLATGNAFVIPKNTVTSVTDPDPGIRCLFDP